MCFVDVSLYLGVVCIEFEVEGSGNASELAQDTAPEPAKEDVEEAKPEPLPQHLSRLQLQHLHQPQLLHLFQHLKLYKGHLAQKHLRAQQ